MSATTFRKFLILGAGPTGLGAAWRLQEEGESDFEILEAGDRVGGLAASYVDACGFTWDIGGHVQFSHYEDFDRVMDEVLGQGDWLTHERESWVWLRGRFVPYPFQNNLRYLPDAERETCLRGLESREGKNEPRNFKEWIRSNLGDGIAEIFLEPYNRKVWACPLEEMDWKWVGERVAVTDLARVRENIRLGRDDVSWGPNATFRFPKRGGTGAIWEAVADRIGRARLRLSSPVVAVNLREKIVETQNGSRLRFGELLSTIPLDRFVGLCGDSLPAGVHATARKLRYSSSNIVGVGLRGSPPESLRKKCWMYFPESDCPFYRVTVFSHYSPANVPDSDSQWSLMAEVAESEHLPVDSSKLNSSVLAGLRATGLISEEQSAVVSTWAYRAGHGYPTPFLGRDAVLAEIHSALESKGVFSRGRFGGWKYEVSNQDHSFMQGMEWTDFRCRGRAERTYFDPAWANAPGKRPRY